ncbi:MAG: beta-lactamase family protein [Lewinella sp.]|nr:beta-lactamase family protein [Lewinella sp.]
MRFFSHLPFAAVCLFTLFFVSCETEQPPTIIRLDGSAITVDSLTVGIQALVDAAEVHGLSVSVFQDGKAAYQRTFGYKHYPERLPLNDTTNMYGASLSKAVFAVLVMRLVEEGVLDLDRPLVSYLPRPIYTYEPQTRWHDDYSDLADDTLHQQITARMCLMHTSGFPNWRWFEPDQRLRVKFKPGSRYHYSGEGLVFLQVVLEKMLGRGLEEIAQEKLFKPLGMTRSSYEWQPAFEADFAYGHKTNGEIYGKDTDNEPRAASTLETTLTDYSIFLEVVLQHKLLADSSWAEMLRPQIRLRSKRQFGPLSLQDTTQYDDIQLSYGLGWGLLKTPYGWGAFKEGHGDGFQHYSIVFPEAGKGILLLANSDNGESIFKPLLELAIRDVYTPWQWEGYIPYDER